MKTMAMGMLAVVLMMGAGGCCSMCKGRCPYKNCRQAVEQSTCPGCGMPVDQCACKK